MTAKAAREPLPKASAIPFRRRGGQLEFCLVTSRRRKRWIFPKGFVEPEETRLAAAGREAWEEAGLRGDVLEQPLGSYWDIKDGKSAEVTVYLMEVSACKRDYREAKLRRRRWFTADAALQKLGHPELRTLLGRAIGRLVAD